MSFNITQTTKDYIEYINRLNDKLIQYAGDIKFKEIALNSPFNLELPEDVGKLENCIYFIKLNNLRKGDAEMICEHITSLKVKDKNTKYPKLNGLNDTDINDTLYIGKSKGKLKNRFKSHLQKTPISTYGLHLENWINDKKFKHIEFKLFYAAVRDLKREKYQDDILELLESGLHLQAKPLLGRSGH